MAENGNLIKITGLWRSQTKAGSVMLSGNFSPTSKLVILPNTYKQKDSDPDYIAFLAPVEKKEGQDSQKQPQIGGL